MRTTPLLIAIILLLAGLLAYEFWQDGRLPFLSRQATPESPQLAAAEAAEAPPPPRPTVIIMQCEGDQSSEVWGLRSAVENGAHYFTLRIQGDGSTEAISLVGPTPVNRGRWDGELANGRFTWAASRRNDSFNYSSTIYGTLDLETGEYSATLAWAPMGPNLETTYYYYGYCRVGGTQ